MLWVHSARRAACIAISVTSVSACMSTASDQDPAAALEEANGVTTPVAVACEKLTVDRGSIGAGQSAAALATKQLSGTADVWKDYVEFSENALARCTFRLPSTIPPSSVKSLAARINYRGPRKSEMLWTIEALNSTTGSFDRVGDNGFASDWVWSETALSLPTASRYLNGSTVTLRYGTSSSYDVSDVDELVLLVTTGSTAPADAGSDSASSDTGAVDSTTPPTDSGVATETGTPDTTTIDTATATDSGSSSDTSTGGGWWQPTPGTSWQWQLTGTLDTSLAVQMYDIDLFDNSAATIASLRARGVHVICYLSAGTYENWRPDASSFPASVLGSGVSGWPGERWLDVRSPAVRAIMQTRMDLAVSKGCDGIEPDNVDGYTNGSGFPLTAADQLDYNRFLATEAHARKLSVALKNDVDQVSALVSSFDFEIDEQCFQYGECATLTPFISAGKAVFEVEYSGSASTVCPKANAMNFDTLFKDLNLSATRTSCR